MRKIRRIKRKEPVFGMILVLIVTVFATVPMNVSAQPTTQWVAIYNGQSNSLDTAMDVAVDSSGNIYVTGHSYSNTKGNEIATVAYDMNGSYKWVAKYNGPGNYADYGTDIVVGPSGDIFVTGYISLGGNNRNYVTLAYDPTGSELWVASYNGPGNGEDIAKDIAVDSNGNVYVTGSTWGAALYWDATTIAYDSSGNELWVATYNGPENKHDMGYAIELDSSGNIYVAGQSHVNGYMDSIIIAYDLSGNQLWVDTYGSPDLMDDGAHFMTIGPDKIYTTGYSKASATYYDYLTIAYDLSTGTRSWVKRYNGPANDEDWSFGIATDSSGNVYVTGRSKGDGTDNDYATVAYDSAGNELWVSRYNGPSNSRDFSENIIVNPQGIIYVTGSSYRSGTGLDFVTIAYDSTGTELWVERFDGSKHDNDGGYALAIDHFGNLVVTGYSFGIDTSYDYTTIKYYFTIPTNDAPIADANGPYLGYEGAAITFDASQSNDPDGDPLEYRWDFNNDGLWDTPWSTSPYALNTWYDDYSGIVEVQVSDGEEIDTNTATVIVNNLSPSVSSITNDGPVYEADPVTITIQATDPGSDTLMYYYDWDNDGNYDEIGFLQSVSHTYNDEGIYTIGIKVTDDDGGIIETSTFVEVTNENPVVSIDNIIQPYEGFILPNDNLEFIGSFTDAGTEDTHTFEWNFGDDTVVTGTLTPTHAYTSAGTYTVTFTVTDDDGDVGTASVEIIIESPAEATQEVFEDIQEMELQNGMNESLSSKLENAIDSMDNDQDTAAVNQLNAFINQVEAQRGKKLTDEEADALIAAAQWIIDNISGE